MRDGQGPEYVEERAAMGLALIVHGGAGTIAPHRHADAKTGCATAAALGWQILRAGGTALDAVTAAIVSLENNPTFNAGTGAVLTREGHAEHDVGIMDGATLDVGAAAGLRRVKNPILLARHILVGPQVFMAGAGAEALAAENSLELCDPDYFISAYQNIPSHKQAATANSLHDPEGKHGTVGAVALDAQGNIVAAASTGGVHGKPSGRIGDTPIAGAGFYAENGIGGAASTGNGEAFIRLALARRALEQIERGQSAQQAADAAITLLGTKVQGDGGIIVIDAAGRIGFARNTTGMSYAFCTGDMTDPEAGI